MPLDRDWSRSSHTRGKALNSSLLWRSIMYRSTLMRVVVILFGLVVYLGMASPAMVTATHVLSA